MTRGWKCSLTFVLLLLSVVVGACAGNPRAFTAIRDGRIALETAESRVMAEAGKPELILAAKGVETFYYRKGSQAVSITLMGGHVVAYDDGAAWPAAAAAAADDASDPVSTGRVRVGMSEAQVVAAIGKPEGLTAADGVETLHWVSGDDVDSVVHLKDGKVVGFEDRPISEFTQNVPRANRGVSTTSGKLRLGMPQADVKRILDSEPDRTSGDQGVVTWEFTSNPVFGDKIRYFVGFKDGRVVSLSELDVSKEEDRKEEEEARRQAAEADAKSQAVSSSILSFLSDPRVVAALAGGGASVSSQTTTKTESRTLTINGTTYTGGEHLGRPCTPDNACPDGYRCVLVTNTAGQCVQ